MKTFERPADFVLGTDPRKPPRVYGSRRHVLEACFGRCHLKAYSNFISADNGFTWGVKKDKMEVAMERTWTEREWGPRTLQLREYPLREFWAIFVDDGPCHSDTFYEHANVQSKAVFSYGVTVMDRICVC